MGGVRVVAQTGANPWNSVRGHRGAHTAAADQHSTIGVAIEYGSSDCFREIGVIRGAGVERADIHNLMTELRGRRHKLVLQIETGMIRTECNAHEFRARRRNRYCTTPPELRIKLALDPSNKAS